MEKGKFIAFEGLDGSGKSTQAELLTDKIKERGKDVFQVDFPQYGKKAAGLVENYLAGKYGEEGDVSPQIASIFFACDRYDGSFEIRKAIGEGRILVADRYVASNAGHQGGKIENDERRKEFLKWLHNLEYEIFNIPKPTITFILKTSPELAFEKAKEKNKKKRAKIELAMGEQSKGDIHERDLDHLKRSLLSYLFLAKEYPKDYTVIECLDDDGCFLPIEEIHERIMKKLKNIF